MGVGWRRELAMQLFERGSSSLQVGVLCDEAGYRFQELRDAGEKFPADRLRGGDRLIDVAQDLTRAIEQRLARDCEFDAMC